MPFDGYWDSKMEILSIIGLRWILLFFRYCLIYDQLRQFRASLHHPVHQVNNVFLNWKKGVFDAFWRESSLEMTRIQWLSG